MTIPHPVAGGAAGQGEPKLVIIPVDNHRMHRPDEDLVVDNRYLDHVEAIQAAWLAKGWTVVRLHYCPMTEELGARPASPAMRPASCWRQSERT